MGIIHVLDFSIANLIAAGEVVDRPASAIKEMMENALDAGATSITVEIKNGGSSFMRVSDNGCGMEREDVPVCVKRHATSKIRQASDLDSILTLGFRGEALAAIASVSRLRIMTRPHGAELGTLLVCENGEIKTLEPTGCPEGTTIIAEELFANIPARRKFLKKDSSETLAVVAAAEKVALSHPETAFRLITDGTLRFSTAGDGKLYNAVYAVLGRDFAKKLIEVRDMTDGIGVSGYIGRPDNVRGNRNCQNFFINGRYIKSATATAALEQAFVSFCPSERFPVCVLNLSIHPALVDVNVHPAKLEVKFSNEKAVFSAVYAAVRNALQQHTSRPVPGISELPVKTSGDDLKELGDLVALRLETAEAAAQMSMDREKLNVTYEQISMDDRDPAGMQARRVRVELPGSDTLRHPDDSSFPGREQGNRTPDGSAKKIVAPRSGQTDGMAAFSSPQSPTGMDASPSGQVRSGSGNAPSGQACHGSGNAPSGLMRSDINTISAENRDPGSNGPSADPQAVLRAASHMPNDCSGISAAVSPDRTSAGKSVLQATDASGSLSSADTGSSPASLPDKGETPAEGSPGIRPDRLPLPRYRIAGIFFNCYVVVELPGKVILIDKHAAHERIIFEQLKENLAKTASCPQILLLPIPLRLESSECSAALEYADELKKIGYDFTVDEAQNAAQLLQIPSEFDRAAAASAFTVLCGELAAGRTEPGISRNTRLEKALFQASCKAAVKGGREDSPEDIRWIVEQVLTLPDIKFCPHGRPVAFEMNEHQIEHLFRRA